MNTPTTPPAARFVHSPVPMTMPSRSQTLKHALAERILVLDGAMGTAIQNQHLTAADFGGPDYEGCNEYLVITRPDVIQGIHEDYLEAGADIVETNTFGGTPLVLDEYGLGARAREINLAASRLARAAAEKYSTPAKPRFVAGSIGPTTKAISVTGGVTFDELVRNFFEQASALIEGGVDYLLIETCQDTRNIKAAVLGCEQAFEQSGIALPIAISGTIEPMGTMLAGQSIEALQASVAHLDLLYIGLNCATGPEFMTDPARWPSFRRSAFLACPTPGSPTKTAAIWNPRRWSPRCWSVLSRTAGSTCLEAAAAPIQVTSRRSRRWPRGASRARRRWSPARCSRASIISRSPTRCAR